MVGEMSSEAIVDLCRRYTMFDWSLQSAVRPVALDRADGVYCWDPEGNRYLDLNSQLMCVNIGYGNKKVVQAISEQAARLPYVAPTHATQVRGELGRLMAEISPGNLTKSLFTAGGAEANENAIKIARMYTGRHKILSRYRSFHGSTAGAITLTGEPRRWASEPGLPGVVHFLDPYCYRCPFGQEPDSCRMECVKHLEEVIAYEGPGNIAAVMIETVTGTNGIIVPPRDYMSQVRRICDKHGILLIADEVMCGFGRTGEWFAVNHWNVVPDIMTVAKGINAGYVPLGATVVSEPIGQFFEEHVYWSGFTYSAHALACAAAIATIGAYKEDRIIENGRKMGVVLGQGLQRLKDKHPSVGDVRQIGLFSCLELVKNRETKEPLVPFAAKAGETGPTDRLGGFLRKNGVLTFIRWYIVHVNPPLVINEQQLTEGLEVLDRGLELTDAAVEG